MPQAGTQDTEIAGPRERIGSAPSRAVTPRETGITGTELNFPIVADPDHRLAELYDMIHPGEGDTSTVRSVFIVDPDDKLRLMLTDPKSVGRNFNEIVRVIDALQATDKDPIATPADWQPGDRVIVGLSVPTEEARAKFENVEEFKPYLRYADAPK